MKEAKIKKFLNLIESLHHSSKHQPTPTKNHEQLLCHNQSPRHYNTINLQQQTRNDHSEVFQREYLDRANEHSRLNIFFNDKTIKRRYEDKKNFYEAYRETLQKKKEHLSNSNKKNTEKLLKEEEEKSYCKQLEFPISRTRRRGQRRESYTFQKILRKKSLLLSNRSVSIVPYDSEKRLKMERLKKIDESAKEGDEMKDQEECMREKRLNYKPIFRIKKISLESCRLETQAVQDEQSIRMEKCVLAKKCMKVKTEPIEGQSRNISFRDIIQKKKKEKLANQLDKFTAWDHDKALELEQTSRLFF